MPDTKISDLTSNPSITGAEEIPVAKSGSNFKTTLSQIYSWLQGLFVTSVNGQPGAVTLDAGDVGAVPVPVNYALASNGATVTATQTVQGNINNVIDGIRNTQNDFAIHGWRSADISGPQYITIDFGQSRSISEIVLYMLLSALDYTNDPQENDTANDYALNTYTVQYWDGATWQNLSSAAGNNKAIQRHRFSAITTDQIRIHMISSISYPFFTVVEVEAWSSPDVQAQLLAHEGDTNNPHSVTAAQVGLGNVDNTSDLNKPISTATQTALNDKQDEMPIHGELISRTTFPDDSEWTEVGGIVATPSSGTLVLSNGASNVARYITFDPLISSNQKQQAEILFSVPSGGFGITLGIVSSNAWLPTPNWFAHADFSALEVSLNLWYNGGNVFGSGYLTGLSPSTDDFRMVATFVDNVITIDIWNVTTGEQGKSLSHTIDNPTTTLLPNTGKWAVGTTNASQILKEFKVNSLARQNAKAIIVGDSKMHGIGLGTDFLKRMGNQLNIDGVQVIENFAGNGDRTVEQVLQTQQIIDHAPEYVIMTVGRNDLASGVSSGTWQANYQQMRDDFVAAGIGVIHLIGMDEPTQNQSTLWSWILSTFLSDTVVNVLPDWDNGTYVTDTIHPNLAGHNFLADTMSRVLNWYKKESDVQGQLPTGGTAGQVLNKINSTNYNAQWSTIWTLLAQTASTGTAISFDVARYYGKGTAETGNITQSLTGAIEGMVGVIRHNAGSEPSYPASWVKTSDSGNYTNSVDNYIWYWLADAATPIVHYKIYQL